MSFFSTIFAPNGTSSNGTPVNPVASRFPTQVDPNQQQQQQQQQTQQTTTTDTAASPLDQFNKLWQTPTTADGKPVTSQVPDLTAPIFNFDAAKIQESASKMDFTSAIAPETISKALGGDAAAFGEAINAAVRQAVVGLTMNQGNLINQAVAANNQRVTQALPTQIKHTQLMNMEDDNPVYSHPAVQPLVTSLKQMAFAKNPQASPAEINKQISDYMAGLSAAIAGTSPEAKQQQAATKAAEGQDWSSFLG